MKKLYNVILVLAGFIILFFVIYKIGFLNVFSVFARASYSNFLFVLLFFSLSQLIRIGKWKIMSGIAKLETKTADIANFYFHTRILGMITPFRSGEIIPTFLEKEKDKFLSMTLADRFYESLTTIMVAVAAFVFLFSGVFQKNFWPVIIFFILVLVLFYVIFTVESVYLFFRSIAVRKKTFEKNNFVNKLVVFFDKLFIVIKKTLGIKNSAVLLFLTLTATILDVLVFKYIFEVVNIHTDIFGAATAFSFLSLVNFISPTPSGIGIGDAGYLSFSDKIGFANGSQIASFLILTRIASIAMILFYILVISGYNKLNNEQHKRKSGLV
ncbi:MAG: hypothetical protein COS25_02560 [Candidatus Nealsonbacteria bacterium CG02_land_8_20_14_3_00_37_10]|uniref:TIGR00374 family protein n=2 Tax=Candidatus Nealsoniibacteriota TaxID=1817911 RepID=A0A2G9YXZ2_9BACT|nr:MAG: hypothetical protein COX35_02665 [Candidatus Nealsonbacteria bacterium CG23_combo_of_CG06-09_8_20_14_all_37_18]PIV44934.1 MAG: hypothetical protein COS25_02560 [Candidatus Nealsonbacteria bacterium CG02_land_8_20_14_3_00_37_10]